MSSSDSLSCYRNPHLKKELARQTETHSARVPFLFVCTRLTPFGIRSKPSLPGSRLTFRQALQPCRKCRSPKESIAYPQQKLAWKVPRYPQKPRKTRGFVVSAAHLPHTHLETTSWGEPTSGTASVGESGGWI